MKRLRRMVGVLAVVGASAGVVVAATTSPVSAEVQPGCQAYGQFVAGAAQTGALGGTVSGVATSGPGALADLAASLRQGTCASS